MTFIRTADIAPGATVVVPPVHVEYDSVNGYRIVEGIGRQTPTQEAAK